MPLNNSWGTSRPANPLWNIWANDKNMLDLYRSRCLRNSEEMTCATQLADLIIKHSDVTESFLDVGCGGGYYYNSLRNRGFSPQYFGIDHTPEMIELAQEQIGRIHLSENHFRLMSIEDLDYSFDNIICFHVLTNAPHYMYLLDRILSCARKKVFIRENINNQPSYVIDYRPDPYLDEGKRHMNVYHNIIPMEELRLFAMAHGFQTTEYVDKRTKGLPEIVCDIPHIWKVLLLERTSA
jgi:SAM-dependent methyltransferase